jgi:hypothetical protein
MVKKSIIFFVIMFAVLFLAHAFGSVAMPMYSNPSVNSTLNGSVALFTLNWSNDVDLSEIYNVTNVKLLVGINNSGGASSLSVKDNIYWNVSEVASAGALQLLFNMTMDDDIHKTDMYLQYLGNPSHSMTFAIWNFNNSVWENITIIPSSTSFAWYNNTNFYDTHIYTDANNITQYRLAHNGNGVATHWVAIDYLVSEDNDGLNGYIFSTDNSGTWVNDSFTSMTGIYNQSSNLLTLNGTKGITINWKVYANDTENTITTFSSSLVTTALVVTPYGDTSYCPITTTPETMLFIFLGLLVLGFMAWASWTSRLIISVIAGLFGIVWSFQLFACFWIFGAVVLLGSILYIMYEAFLRFD